jgi:hypothetical protein
MLELSVIGGILAGTGADCEQVESEAEMKLHIAASHSQGCIA